MSTSRRFGKHLLAQSRQYTSWVCSIPSIVRPHWRGHGCSEASWHDAQPRSSDMPWASMSGARDFVTILYQIRVGLLYHGEPGRGRGWNDIIYVSRDNVDSDYTTRIKREEKQIRNRNRHRRYRSYQINMSGPARNRRTCARRGVTGGRISRRSGFLDAMLISAGGSS